MIPVEILLTFVAASALLSISPGPDNIFVLAQSAQNGPKAGVLVTLGLCTGLIVHTSAVALGVAAILQALPIAFTILKLLGALYLLYLAWLAFSLKATEVDVKSGNTMTFSGLYRRGIIMNITNPKVSIFFLAFLPQFASPDNGSIMLQLFLLGGVFMIVALVIFSVIALLSGQLGHWISHSGRAQFWLNKIAATVFAGLAIRLVLSDTP